MLRKYDKTKDMIMKIKRLSLRDWQGCIKSAIAGIARNVWALFYTLALGLFSLIIWLIVSVEDFCRREPKAALIMGIIIVFLSVGWILCYVDGRAQLLTAQYERDSVSIMLDRIKYK